MNVTIVLDNGTRHTAKTPYQDAPHVELDLDCPHGCKRRHVANPNSSEREPLKVRSNGVKHQNHDTMFGDAIPLCCRKKIGTIEVSTSTIFGLEEDARVLGGPWKVY